MLRTAGIRLGRMSLAIGSALQDFLYPYPCLVCGGNGEDSPLCADCRDEICDTNALACPRCAQPVGPFAYLKDGCSACRSHRLGFDGAVALGPYQGPIRELCLRMKRLEGAWLARWMADLVLDVRGDAIGRSGASAVVAVPLHWRRRCSRGYNQADALASRFARRLGLPKIGGLRRVLHTPKLSELSRTERAKTLGKSFFAAPSPGLKGRTILLVDDILTTGATCGAAAKALKKAGAARVIAVVVARA